MSHQKRFCLSAAFAILFYPLVSAGYPAVKLKSPITGRRILTVVESDYYYATTSITIKPGAKLIIQAGVTLFLQENKSLKVQGELELQGDPATKKQARITSDDWERARGIRVVDGGTLIMVGGLIEHMKTAVELSGTGKLTADTSRFHNNLVAIKIRGTAPVLIENSTFDDNNDGIIIDESSSSLTMRRCLIERYLPTYWDPEFGESSAVRAYRHSGDLLFERITIRRLHYGIIVYNPIGGSIKIKTPTFDNLEANSIHISLPTPDNKADSGKRPQQTTPKNDANPTTGSNCAFQHQPGPLSHNIIFPCLFIMALAYRCRRAIHSWE